MIHSQQHVIEMEAGVSTLLIMIAPISVSADDRSIIMKFMLFGWYSAIQLNIIMYYVYRA